LVAAAVDAPGAAGCTETCDHAAVESAAISSADASGMCSSVMMRSPSVVWGIIVLGMPNDVPAAASAAAAAV
jgi:hypothetical protein